MDFMVLGLIGGLVVATLGFVLYVRYVLMGYRGREGD
jgi:hypothetical protein